jgi:hypothetical protein
MDLIFPSNVSETEAGVFASGALADRTSDLAGTLRAFRITGSTAASGASSKTCSKSSGLLKILLATCWAGLFPRK